MPHLDGVDDGNGYGVSASSSKGFGVLASSDTGTALRGLSAQGDGVQGFATGFAKDASGVRGLAGGDGTGVLGTSTSGPGVAGSSTTGPGVSGSGQNSDGVAGSSASAAHSGVWGNNTSGGPGVAGSSVTGPGVNGLSIGFDGVHGESRSAQHSGVAGINNSGGIGVYGSSNGLDGVHGESQSAQHSGVVGINNSGGIGVYGSSNGLDGVHGESQSAQHSGVAGINNSGGIGVYGSSNGLDGVSGVSTSKTHAGLAAVNDSGGFGVWARGTPAGRFEGDIEVTGDIRCHDVLLANKDCAEDFEMSGTGEVGPGSVVVIGSDAKLKQCFVAYDKRVAGVISGAGDCRPGIILGRDRMREHKMPVALLGTAYCKVDAGYSPIEVGDLLTTSPTIGHAMKAVDPLKAFGSVIGKALRRVESGQDLIPILITLQ